jgi:hypothetical protein
MGCGKNIRRDVKYSAPVRMEVVSVAWEVTAITS